MDDTKTRYCFLVDWFDIHAQLTRHYELFYYPYDSTVEMVDSLMLILNKSKNIYLKYYSMPAVRR